MTWLVALLTLTAAPQPSLLSSSAPADGIEAIEYVALPSHTGPLTLTVRAMDGLVVLEAPRSAHVIARTMRNERRVLCENVEELATEVHLHCRSKRIIARLQQRGDKDVLVVSETRGLPWTGIDAPPLAAFEPSAAGLGGPCPGTTAAGRAECLIARGDLQGARAELQLLMNGPTSSEAALRLGDIALALGDAFDAGFLWNRVKEQPWARLAAARLCDAASSCFSRPEAETIYATNGLPAPLARDLLLRRARVVAFLGRSLEAVHLLAQGSYDLGACEAAPSLCQRVAHAALLEATAEPADVLTFWAAIAPRERGPRAYESELAAASLAEHLGAPTFGASILASGAGQVPIHAMPEYLRRTAELYLASGDRVRAGVIVEFARSRIGKDALTGPRWAAILRGLTLRGKPAPEAQRLRLQTRATTTAVTAALRVVKSAQALTSVETP